MKTILIIIVVGGVTLVALYAILASILEIVHKGKEKKSLYQSQQLKQLEKNNKELRMEVQELHKIVEDLKNNMQKLDEKKESSPEIQNKGKNNNYGKNTPTEKQSSAGKSETSKTLVKPTTSYEERARAEKEARQREEELRRERYKIERKSEILKQIEPFLKEHAKNSHSGERILEYYEKKRGSITDNAVWTADKWRIISKEKWAAHSFFDDGGGREGYHIVEIAYIRHKGDYKIENEKLSDLKNNHSNEHFYCENPFGLSGVYEIKIIEDEWHTD